MVANSKYTPPFLNLLYSSTRYVKCTQDNLKNNKHTVIIIATVALVTLAGVVIWLNPFRTGQNGGAPDVSSFDDCVRAGYPVMESFPRQCKTPDGRNFVEQINGKQESGISGMVLLGPTCPVIRDPPDEECADKPYATTLVVTTADQARVIKEFRSEDTGKFIVQVEPGEYAIRSAAASNILPYCSSSGTIKVNASAYTETIVNCDTGIR
jgi:hypothetical protein